jgi:hypothetical protein
MTTPFMLTQYFKEYKRLGGKKNKKVYGENLEVFFEETYDIFIDGNTIYHKSREEAVKSVMKWLRISAYEFNLIFESVDNVTAYT